MIAKKKTVRDVESALTYLSGVAADARAGGDESVRASPYVRGVIAGAEAGLRKLGFYERVLQVVEQWECLLVAKKFEEAQDVVLGLAKDMQELSGTNDKLRKLYGPRGSNRKQ